MALREPTAGQIAMAQEMRQLLAANPSGLDYLDFGALAGWERVTVVKVAQVLRDVLAAETDTISVPCDPNPADPNGPWLYRLEDGKRIIDPAETRWTVNRIDDIERRAMTIIHVVDAAVRDTDGRTMEGKKARIWRLHLRRAQEEIRLLGSSDGLAE